MRRVLLAVLLCAAAFAAIAQDGRKTTRVLFVGNALLTTGNVPSRFAVLARDMGRPTETETIATPGASLDDHWKDAAVLRAIREGRWDVVVLQQAASPEPEARRDLVEATPRFAAEIRKAGARPALLMAWPSAERRAEFPEAMRSHRIAAERADALLIPAAEAWLRVMSRDQRIRLYSDGTHAAVAGVQLTALAAYMAIFPAGPQEFTEEFIRRAERSLGLRGEQADLFFDAVTLAIDEPMPLR